MHSLMHRPFHLLVQAAAGGHHPKLAMPFIRPSRWPRTYPQLKQLRTPGAEAGQ